MILGSARPDHSRFTGQTKQVFKPVKIPDTASFAGEPMPLNRFDVREALDRELLSNAYFHSQTIRYLKLAPRYFSIIEPILKKKGIPDDFKYLAVAESSLNPRAVSPARAVGFWQFMKGTARDYGLEVSKEVDERYHIE
ncbi:MAG: transglycosylase SLT domain-containing protein, partial [Prolixibacteraceae bacterium]|nr:transglycosylase SLT domain-containing protein [Prolixibacteraceae bacterium]